MDKPGLRQQPQKYNYFGGKAPDNQLYNPYNTPESNTLQEGYTGGGQTHPGYSTTLLTHTAPLAQTNSRADWQYNPPVSCVTHTQTERSTVPGFMGQRLTFIYRGRSTSYVYNYGAGYYQGSEGAQRGLLRSFGASAQPGNQPSIAGVQSIGNVALPSAGNLPGAKGY